MHAGNLLFDKDTFQFTSLLDWEHAKMTVLMDEKLGMYNFANELDCVHLFIYTDEIQKIKEFDDMKCKVMHCVWACITVASWFISCRGERENLEDSDEAYQKIEFENAKREFDEALLLFEKKD